MKLQLTKEQSRNLIDLGVPKEKASLIQPTDSYEIDDLIITNGVPIFNLTDLLEMLPKEIECKYGLTPIVITFGGTCNGDEVDGWFAYYDDILETIEIGSNELIDALYKLIVYVLENKLLKL